MWNINSISPILQKKEIISATKSLLIFNPEHDFALAVGQGAYTPPASVIKLRRENSLLPALYADNGDFIILPDDFPIELISKNSFYDLAVSKDLSFIHLTDIPTIVHNIGKVIPWGWNNAIRRALMENGVEERLLPSLSEIDELRNLSHRHTAIKFREKIASILFEQVKFPASELFSVSQVEPFLKQHPKTFFKAPWSSSGRGIVVSDHISLKGLLEWAHGTIRRQGSIIAEPAWNKVLDFATEWEIIDGIVHFLGYSVFETSSRGKYHKNITSSQSDLLNIIQDYTPYPIDKYVKAQSMLLKNLIAPKYNGPLGIDMLADDMGDINPCVELNLRMTMGHVGIKQHLNNSLKPQ